VSTVSPETAGVAQPAPATTPGTPVSFEDAKTSFTDKRYDEAVRLFTTYTTEHPDNVWGFYMLGLSAWKSGDRDGAVTAFGKALEKDSNHVKSRLNLSRVLIEQGKAQEALPHVEAAITIDSTLGEGYRLLGRVRDELGDKGGAVEAFKHAIVLDGRDVWSLNNIGSVYIAQGRFDDAIGPLALGVELDSTVASFHNNLGFALEHTGRIEQAKDAYRAALAIDSSYHNAVVNLARVEKLKQDSTVTPVDLGALAQSFVQQEKTWR
jgi:predicted Zn-dependent protease